MNANNRKIESEASGAGISTLTWNPDNYRYDATNTGGGIINGSSAQNFGVELLLGGTGMAKGMLTLRGPDNTKRVSFSVQDAHDEQQTYQLTLDFHETGGYALVSTDAGIMSWAAFSGGNSYITDLTSYTPNSRYKATLSDSAIVTGTALTSFGPQIKLAGTNAGHVDFYEAAAGGVSYIKLQATAALGASKTLTLPADYPTTSGYALVSTTAGVMSWATNSDANYYVTGGTYDAVADEIDFSGNTDFPAFSVDTGPFTKGVTVAGTANYMGYFTATNALTGTVAFQYDATDIDTTDADMTMTSATTLKPELTLTNTNTDATSAYLTFYQNDSVNYGDAGDTLGTIKF